MKLTKQEYLKELRKNLKGFSQDEIDDILYDYEEHFSIGLSSGKTEEEIAEDLGDPKDIADQYKKAKGNPTIEETARYYKEKAKEALKGLNISDIDILTQNGTKKPIVSVQVIFNKTNKKEVEEFAKEIKEKIEPISNLYDITILDKNNNVIATAGYENNEINFIE